MWEGRALRLCCLPMLLSLATASMKTALKETLLVTVEGSQARKLKVNDAGKSNLLVFCRMV
jgi:hypothetical protein